MKTKYDTDLGPVFIDAKPYCKGCRNFVPDARLGWAGTKVKYDALNMPVYDGVILTCKQRFMCDAIRKDILEDMKKEEKYENRND